MIFRTWNTVYTLRDMGDGGWLISGHAKYCPVPVPCTLKEPVTVGRRVVAQITGSVNGRYDGPLTTTPVMGILP